MVDRRRRLDAFLARAGWTGAGVLPLAGDASFRRYHRVRRGERRAVVMDAPPAHEDVRPFVALARHLRALGFSAPRIHAEDAAEGFLLIEDVGDDTYTRLLTRPRVGDPDEWALYALAVDVLIALHRRPPRETVPEGLAPYDDRRLMDEANLLVDWYLPAVGGGPLSTAARDAYARAWLAVFPVVHAQPRTLVLRDFHVDNLMWLAGRHGIAACGLLDFQDAVAGPPAYDLMSLLEDARRDIDPGLVGAMMARYRAAFPDLDVAGFCASYAVLAAQRHAKVIGIFTRLCRRDGKCDYLVHVPRVWRMLEAALAVPILDPVARWFENHVPRARRIRPDATP